MVRMLRFEWELPEETFGPGFEEQSFVRTVKEAAVVKLLRGARISHGKAAGNRYRIPISVQVPDLSRGSVDFCREMEGSA